MLKRLKAAWKALRNPEIIEPEIQIIEVVKEVRDPVTGLMTRNTFEQVVNREFSRAKRSNQDLVIVYVDLDNFKEVNDTKGHLAGDKYLKKFADIALQNIRSFELLARWGGDEFTLLLSATEEDAGKVMERIHNSFPNFSWGITAWNKYEQLEYVIDLADSKMYDMKNTK
jgi:diguanylate cyclase (GGDEF)-like protein